MNPFPARLRWLINLLILIPISSTAETWNPLVNFTLPSDWDCVNGAIVNTSYLFHCNNGSTPLFKVTPTALDKVTKFSISRKEWTARDMHVSESGEIYLLGNINDLGVPLQQGFSPAVATFDQNGVLLNTTVRFSNSETAKCHDLLVTAGGFHAIVDKAQSALVSWDASTGKQNSQWISASRNNPFKRISAGLDSSIIVVMQNVKDIFTLSKSPNMGSFMSNLRLLDAGGTYLTGCLRSDNSTISALLDYGNGKYEIQTVDRSQTTTHGIDIETRFRLTDAICDSYNDGFIALGVSGESELGLFQIASDGHVLYMFNQTTENLTTESWMRIHGDGRLSILTASKPAKFFVFEVIHMRSQSATPTPSPNIFQPLTETIRADILPIIILSALILLSLIGLGFMHRRTSHKPVSKDPIQMTVLKSAQINEKQMDPYGNSPELIMREGVQYKSILSLQEGSHSFLYLGAAKSEYLLTTHGKHLILKFIKPSKRNPASFYRELKIITALRTEARVVGLVGYTVKPHGFILKNYTLGSLMGYFTNRQNKLTKQSTIAMMTELVLAIEAVHKLGVTHGYVRPSNVLLDQMADKKLRCVLTDFEFCLIHDNSVLNLPQDVFVPVAPVIHVNAFMAPEMFSRSNGVDASVPFRDIYAFAMINCAFLLRKDPWKAQIQDSIQPQ